jgi:hypothetical protein
LQYRSGITSQVLRLQVRGGEEVPIGYNLRIDAESGTKNGVELISDGGALSVLLQRLGRAQEEFVLCYLGRCETVQAQNVWYLRLPS